MAARTSPRVAIVGGGPGGLMTAYLLQKKAGCLLEVSIFEASDRLGGKILTPKFSQAPVCYEAGAAEFYDYSAVDEDPLKELIRELGLPISRRSLTAYLLHHVLHLWPLWLFAIWQGQEPTYYWRQATGVWVALALAGLFLFVCYGFFVWLEKTGRPAVENLMRWLCD